ncbi:hypothetical protein DFH09DRAFT_957012, partial [Mycena vulgaris]
FANRSLRFIDTYSTGINGSQAAWFARKYHGHRVLPPLWTSLNRRQCSHLYARIIGGSQMGDAIVFSENILVVRCNVFKFSASLTSTKQRRLFFLTKFNMFHRKIGTSWVDLPRSS